MEAIFNKKIFFKVVFFVLFFVITAAIMAVSILVIYKLSEVFGCDLSLSSLVICGVAALLINFSVITFTPFLTRSYYYTLGGMIAFAALGTTCYNKYLLYRRRKPALAGAAMASQELTDEVMEPLAPVAAAEPEIAAVEAVKPAPLELEPVIEEKKELDNPPLTELPEPIAAIVADLAREDAPEILAEPAAVEPQADDETETEAAAPAEAQDAQGEIEPADILAAQAPVLPIETDAEPEFEDEPAPAEPIPELMALSAAIEAAAPENGVQPAAEATTEYEAEDIAPELLTAEDAANNTTVEAEAAVEPEEELEPVAEPMPESFAQQLAAMKTLDHLLDYAFERNSHNRKQQAIWAYEAALERYGDDAYAPFVVIEMVNIHKSLGHYQAAISCLSTAMELPAVAANPGMQQQFQDNLLYLSAVKQVLAESHQKNLPLNQISKDSMLEIESLYKQSKSR